MAHRISYAKRGKTKGVGRQVKKSISGNTVPLFIRQGVSRAINKIIEREDVGVYVLADRLGTTANQLYRWLQMRSTPSLSWMIRILRRYPYAGQFLGWNIIIGEGTHDNSTDGLRSEGTGEEGSNICRSDMADPTEGSELGTDNDTETKGDEQCKAKK